MNPFPTRSVGFWAIAAIVVVCVLYVGAYGWLRLDHAMIHTYDRGSGHGIHFSHESIWLDLQSTVPNDRYADDVEMNEAIEARARRGRILEWLFWPLRKLEGAIHTLTGRGEP